MLSCNVGRVVIAPEGLYFIPLAGSRWHVVFSEADVLENKRYRTRHYYKLRSRATGRYIRFYIPENVSKVWRDYFEALTAKAGETSEVPGANTGYHRRNEQRALRRSSQCPQGN